MKRNTKIILAFVLTPLWLPFVFMWILIEDIWDAAKDN
jgi:hypothetical protein